MDPIVKIGDDEVELEDMLSDSKNEYKWTPPPLFGICGFETTIVAVVVLIVVG